MISQTPASRFRKQLQSTISAAKKARDCIWIRVLETLKRDFDTLFPPAIWETEDGPALDKLITKYCHKPRLLCPICGEKMISREGKRGLFYGCTYYPNCGGARGMDFKPTINIALRSFITKREEEEKQEMSSSKGRFAQLEL